MQKHRHGIRSKQQPLCCLSHPVMPLLHHLGVEEDQSHHHFIWLSSNCAHIAHRGLALLRKALPVVCFSSVANYLSVRSALSSPPAVRSPETWLLIVAQTSNWQVYLCFHKCWTWSKHDCCCQAVWDGNVYLPVCSTVSNFQLWLD